MGIKRQVYLHQLNIFRSWDTDKDSHKTLPVINGSMKRLNEVELYPFKKLIDDGVVESVMTAHLSVPSLDKKYPSSLSKKQ